MTLAELQSQESNLRDMMLLTYDNREVYLSLLSEYEQCIRNSFLIDPDWHLMLACEIQEQIERVEETVTIPEFGTFKRLKDGEDFDKYTCLWDIAAILLED